MFVVIGVIYRVIFATTHLSLVIKVVMIDNDNVDEGVMFFF